MGNLNKQPLVYRSRIIDNIFVEDNVRILNCEILGVCYMGYQSYINSGTIRSYVEIGRYCSIGRNVSIGLGTHNINSLSTSSFFETSDQIKLASNDPKRRVKIGNDVWIGDNVLIDSGLNIGDGCIIGAGSVVTKDIEPYSIIVGVPGRLLRMRFDDVLIDELKRLKWWEYPPNVLKENQDIDINKFIFNLKNINDFSKFEINYTKIDKSKQN